MKIRNKLIIISTAIVVLYTVGLIGLLAAIMGTRFSKMERELAAKDIGRVRSAIDAERESLVREVRDYAFWDDAWMYARGELPEFADANFTPDTYENTRLDFVAIYDRSGRLAFDRYLSAQGLLEPWDFFPDSLPVDGILGKLIADGAGYIAYEGRIFLAASRLIAKSDGSLSDGAYLIMGRAANEEFFTRIARGTEVDFIYVAGSPPSATKGVSPQRQALPSGLRAFAGNSYLEIPQSRLSIIGYSIFDAPDGTPVFHIRTDSPMILTSAGLAIVKALGIIWLVMGLSLWFFTRAAFSRLIGKPLAHIESACSRMDLDSPKTELPFAEFSKRNDEIGEMSRVLNSMGERLVSSYELVRATNENLETEVETRTAALAEANRNLALYGKILSATSEGVLVTDQNALIVDANAAQSSMSGFSKEELIGKNPRIMKSDRHDQAFYKQMWADLIETGTWAGELWDRRKNGEIYPKLLMINTIRDETGDATHYVGISTEITAIKRTEQRLHRLAYYDPLTDLPNRALFGDRLARTIVRANRMGGRAGLLFIDLDRFKNINDTLGHSAGDDLLIGVAARIVSRVRETDTVCRLGGDEFTVILEGLAKDEDAANVAQAIIATMEKPFLIGGEEIHASLSLGIALYPKDGTTSEELFKKADAAMYIAKEEGRGTWRFASDDTDLTSRRRMEIETKLHHALDNGEFRLYFQPQTSAGGTNSGAATGLIGAEALIRWEPEPGTIIGPGAFIQVAEESGIIVRMGEWAIREACREAKTWADAGKPLQVSVNVSARQLDDGRLPEIVASALKETGLEPRFLKLEVTESMFMRDIEKAIATMIVIRSTGVSFAIDDFGTGYSSLQYLNRLPVDSLKIDKAFVSNIADSLSGGEIVTAVISMARAFGLTSIAEGVETDDQLEALKMRGCDEIQGFLVSEPLPAAEFRRFALSIG